MNCQVLQERFDLLLYKELSRSEEEEATRHLQTCFECQQELQRVKQIHESLTAVAPVLPPYLLQDSRRNLRLALSATVETEPAVWQRYWPALRNAFAGAALLAVGFFCGRLTPTSGAASGITALGTAAPEKAQFAGPAAYRVRSVEPSSSGRIQLVVDETTQRVLTGEPDEQRIQTLLLSAAREASDPGVRVETVDLLRSQSHSAEVRTALLGALRHDTNAGVRLKALEGLREWSADPETRKTLAQVLLHDSNPGVRTQAVDLLTQKREPALVGVLQELLARESNNYVRLKCQKVLQEMNASTETF